MKTVIVPPMLLVKLFGAETVTLPSKIGEDTSFKAHGITWFLKRNGRDTWTLASFKDTPEWKRVRFGNKAEIIEDIGHVMETGHLPRSKESCA